MWNKGGCFVFDRLHKILSPRALKPSVDFNFSLQLIEKYSLKNSNEKVPLRDTFVKFRVDDGAAGDARKGNQTTRSSISKFNKLSFRSYNRAKSHPALSYTPRKTTAQMHDQRDASTEVNISVETKDANIDTEDLLPISTSPPSSSLPLPTSSSLRSPKRCENTEQCNVAIDTEELTTSYNIGVNTELSENTEALTIKMIKELEAWKAQQMDEFCTKLERKEIIYLKNLEKDWQLEHGGVLRKLEERNHECEELKQKLDQIKEEIEARKVGDANLAKLQVEQNYVENVQKLKLDIQQWKLELQKQQQSFAIAQKHAMDSQQKENLKMQHENEALKRNISHLEQKLLSLGKTHFSTDQLKEMMTDMRQQTERFANVEKERNMYKAKFNRATRELQQFKLSVLKQQELNLLRKTKEAPANLNISMDDTSHDENANSNTAFTSKRVEPKIESKLIKEMILKHAESTTSYEDIDSLKSQF